MSERLSGNQIDGLGKRLKESDTPSQDDLQTLQRLLAEHADPLDSVNSRLRDLGLTPHPRLKSTDTIIEKLRREQLTLRGIHDLAGTRVVKRMSLGGQDELVRRIRAACPSAVDPIDRRAAPNNGYRAVHVVCRTDGRWVEIQIRTLYQDTWAQVFEKMGDWFGRQIRYGEPPINPHEPFPSSDAANSKLEIFEAMLQTSTQIAVLEAAENAGNYDVDHPVRRFLYQMRKTFDLPEPD